jgi:hypothetical protein
MSKNNDFIIVIARFRRCAWLVMYERGQRELLLLLCEFVNRKKFYATGVLECWPNIEKTLCPILGRDRTRISADITRLVKRGVIAVEKHGRKNHYVLQQSWLEEAERNRDERWEAWPDKHLDGERRKPADTKPRHGSLKDEMEARRRAVSRPSNGDMDGVELELRGLYGPALSDAQAEKAFVKLDLKLIDLGRKVTNPGGLLRYRFRELMKEGYSGDVIMRGARANIAAARKKGKKADFSSAECLAGWCDSLDSPDMVDDAAHDGDDDCGDEAP